MKLTGEARNSTIRRHGPHLGRRRLDGFREVGIIAALAALALTIAGGSTHRSRFPRTTNGVHLEMVFDYEIPPSFKFPGIDAIWAASTPVSGRYATFYVPYDRDGDAHRTVAWWRRNHPDWIEYRCARAVAAEFGDRNVPLDIANPSVRRWQWAHEIAPALARGFQGIAFDNLSLDNRSRRCGHYDPRHRWIAQFSGAKGLAEYQHTVLMWTKFMRSRLHDAGRTIAINYSYESAVPWQTNLALLSLPDLVFDEAGVTNGGSPVGTKPTERQWLDIFRSTRRIEADGVCYHLNGEEPQDTTRISLPEREWIVANYLLMKSDCTYLYITGYRAAGTATVAPSGTRRTQDYGRYCLFPEYSLAIGHPAAAPKLSNSLWVRQYSHGIVLVNPTDHALAFHAQQRLYALAAASPADFFTVGPHAGLILLPTRGR